MKSRTQHASTEVECSKSPVRRDHAKRTGFLAILATSAVILGAVGLSSCSGYTHAASTGGQPANSDAQISANPTSVAFTNVVVGNSNSQPVTIQNSGNTAVTFTQVTAKGSGFSSSGITSSMTIAAGQSATLTAIFTPASAKSVAGSIVLASDGIPSSLTINLTATGVAATRVLTATPASLSFGTVSMNSSMPLTSTLTNNGNANVAITSISVTGASFSTSGVSNGTILTPGQSATLIVAFAPTVAGAVKGSSVSIASNSTSSPLIINMSGSGQAASAHSVALSWNPSPTTGINGYDVFRATASGAYGTIPLNSSPVSVMSYADTTVVSGQAYFYVVKAVDAGESSANSNEVSVMIP